jgi:hypothetical protein
MIAKLHRHGGKEKESSRKTIIRAIIGYLDCHLSGSLDPKLKITDLKIR